MMRNTDWAKDFPDLTGMLENAPELFEEKEVFSKREKYGRRAGAFLLILLAGSLLSFVPVPCRITGRAVIVPKTRTDLKAVVPGEVRFVGVKEGEKVDKGSAILEIVNDVLIFEQNEVRGNIANLETEIEKGGIRTEYFRKVIEEEESQIRKGFLSPIASRKIELELALLGKDREENLKKICRLKERMLFLQSQIEKGRIRAPISGNVISDPGSLAGTYVKEGEFLMTIVSPESVMEFAVSESKVGKIREGDRVLIRFPALPGQEIAGLVAGIKHYGESKAGRVRNDHVVKVLIQAENHSGLPMKNGTTAKVAIETGWMNLAGKIAEIIRS